MHVSTAQSSLGLLEPRGCSSDPPAAFSQPPGEVAKRAVNVRTSPVPPEHLGQMAWKHVACIEQVPCFAWKIWGCHLFAVSSAGSAR